MRSNKTKILKISQIKEEFSSEELSITSDLLKIEEKTYSLDSNNLFSKLKLSKLYIQSNYHQKHIIAIDYLQNDLLPIFSKNVNQMNVKRECLYLLIKGLYKQNELIKGRKMMKELEECEKSLYGKLTQKTIEMKMVIDEEIKQEGKKGIAIGMGALGVGAAIGVGALGLGVGLMSILKRKKNK